MRLLPPSEPSVTSAFFRANQNTLVYRGAVPDYQLTWHNRSGDTLGVAGEPGQYLGVALSPDGTMAAVARENRLNRFDQDLWMIDLRRNTTQRFTTDALLESIPTWSSDGQSLIYGGGQNGASILRKRLDGGTQEVLLEGSLPGDLRVNALLTTISASGDGRFLTFKVDTRTTRRSDVWSFPLQGPGKAAALIQEEHDEIHASVSRKGDWLAYVSNETGANEIFARRISADLTTGVRTAGPAIRISPPAARRRDGAPTARSCSIYRRQAKSWQRRCPPQPSVSRVRCSRRKGRCRHGMCRGMANGFCSPCRLAPRSRRRFPWC